MSLQVVDPPKHYKEATWNCGRCGEEDLKHPVFLSDGSCVGTGCAAILLGWSEQHVTRERKTRVLRKAYEDKTGSERRQRYSNALAEYEREGSGIVNKGSGSDFNRLRAEHARTRPDLLRPSNFAAYLKQRVDELS